MEVKQKALTKGYFSQLPNQTKLEIVKAVDAMYDQRAEELVAKSADIRNASGSNLVDYVNEYLMKGYENSEVMKEYAYEAVAKAILRDGMSVEKATTDLVVGSGATGGAGLMNQAYGNAFFENASKQAGFYGRVEMFQMSAPTEKIDRFLRGARFLYVDNFNRATNTDSMTGRALKEAQYYGYTVSKTELTARNYHGVVRVPAEDLKDGILGGRLVDYVLNKAITEQMPYDMDDLLINGDTTILPADVTSNPDLQLLKSKDGLLRLAGFTVNAASNVFTHVIAGNVMKVIPDEHKRRTAQAQFFLPANALIDYAVSLGNSATNLGFMAATQGEVGAYPVLGRTAIPLDVLPARTGLYCDPKVLKLGIWEAVTIESEYEPKTNEYVFYVRTRMDFVVLEPQQVVKITNIGAP